MNRNLLEGFVCNVIGEMTFCVLWVHEHPPVPSVRGRHEVFGD